MNRFPFFVSRISRVSLVCTALFLAVGHAALSQVKVVNPARVTGSVTSGKVTKLANSVPQLQFAKQDLGKLDSETRLDRMILTLKPSSAQEQELGRLLEAQTTPGSSDYHHWLTPSEFGERFGVAASDVNAVTSWLQSNGFSVDEVSTGRRAIVFSGTQQLLRSAFHTELHRFQMQNNELRISSNAIPEIPEALAPVVSGLLSLNDRPRIPQHRNLGMFQLDKTSGIATRLGASVAAVADQQGSATGPVSPQLTVAGSNNRTYRIVGPYDFATIYNLKPLWDQGIDGTGQSIAIVSRSDLDLADVDRFRSVFGLPPTKVNKIFAGRNPGVNASTDETALDVQWSGAVAKNATIQLVIGGTTLTTDGVDLSSLYIVNNNVAPIVSVSYGACELGIGSDGNSFYNSLWQQAAAQGQTVFVSTGDAGAATCDQGQSYSTIGLSVNGLGSTPYNVAVGGTDLYGSFSNPSAYWNATNDPVTLQSVRSYVPELPWNDSCGNPVVLEELRNRNGYTDTTTAALCNNSKVDTTNYRTLAGGGGGASNCLSTTDGTVATCTGGYKRPSWQTGQGVPNDQSRYVPDVSLFAGDGLWSSFLPYCVSSQTSGSVCDPTTRTNLQGAGGTSFASPAFAGIMALINQKTGASQGNANPTFYKLANSQASLDCTVENTSAPSGCIFHDASRGGNAIPCFNRTKAKDCLASDPSNDWGVTTGYAANRGYDPAVGLGSVNIQNLVNGWATAYAALPATTTTLTLSSATGVYGSGPKATVQVSSAGGTPTGDFTVLNTQSGRQDSNGQGTLANGAGTLQLTYFPAGSYSITAHYPGDGSFAPSDSVPQTVTIAKAQPRVTITPSRTTITSGQSSRLNVVIASPGGGVAPTGTLVVTNMSTGVGLGSYPLIAAATGSTASAAINVDGTALPSGANTLSLSYSGDGNYTTATGSQVLTFSAPFGLTLSPASVTVTTGAATTTASSTISIAAVNGVPVAYPIALSCNGTLPAGATCALSTRLLTAASTGANITVSYTPLVAAVQAPVIPLHRGAVPVAIAGLPALLALLIRRKGRPVVLLGLLFLAASPALLLNGCAGSPAVLSSSVSLESSVATANLGDTVVLKAGVTGSSTSSSPSATPTGTVTLDDSFRGSVRSLGTATLDSSQAASLSRADLGLGTHSITAVYRGDGSFPVATSAPVSVTVSTSASLTITATDANGYTVTVPLGVTLQ